MLLSDLKTKILNNTLDDSPIIFKYADNKYLCYHYIEAICKQKQKVYINSINEILPQDDLFEETNQYVYILDIDKLEEKVNADYKNLIVLCKDIAVDLEIDLIETPKLLDWQIEDYIKARLTGLDEVEIKWLCSICNYDIYRLDNECKKIELFSEASQRIIFKDINDDNGYSDLNNFNIFSFTNSLMKKDYNSIKNILLNIQNIDIEAMGIVTIMIKQVKNLIDIQINPHNTASSLNMNPKQFNAIKYNVGKFRNDQLIDMFEFLTEIDYRLKSGELSFDETSDTLTRNIKLIDYITINLVKISLS